MADGQNCALRLEKEYEMRLQVRESMALDACVYHPASHHAMPVILLQDSDAQWVCRLEQEQAAAAAAKDGVRRELDAQIEAITRRLNELSTAEARRERRRTELAEEVPSRNFLTLLSARQQLYSNVWERWIFPTQ